jgi:hypothetical protein
MRGAVSGGQRCAPAALDRGDDLVATAASVTRWLLVEQPGRWGRDALLHSQLDPATGRRLAAAAAERGIRVVLIRRPGRSGPGPTRRWAYADSRLGRESIRWGSYADHAELLDRLVAGVSTGWSDGPADGNPDSRPTYLVCAHGRHDACCAIRGRPVAAALRLLRPGLVWECSHIGGDRFAANVLVLPEGLYYGHVDVVAAPEIVAAYDAGEVVPQLLRGRSSLAAPVQAAQQQARLLLGERRIDALAPIDMKRVAPGTWRVVLARGDRPVAVTVRAEAAPPQLLTCSSVRPEAARVFRLLGWEDE